MGNHESEKRKDMEKKGQRKLLTNIALWICLVAGGAVVSLALIGLPAKDYQKACEEIDSNLTMCINQVGIQEKILTQMNKNILVLQNQTQYITDKNMEFGSYICKEQGLYYYPNMDTIPNEIICYNSVGDNNTITLGVVKE